MKYLLSNELRELFIAFFKEKGHKHILSSSLIPAGDNSIMFTNAGMVQFKDYFTGISKPSFNRAVTVQKCMRAGGKHNDLENVGKTTRHHTFFEMLGNFSFGDYFKNEAIEFAWDFLINELEIDDKKLFVTVHKNDEEGYLIWKDKIKIDEKKIYKLDDETNLWQMGDIGPCGYSSEIFFDTGFSEWGHAECDVTCDCGRYLEIWNLVFMQFERDINGKLSNLPKPSIDTGMGLERVVRVLQNVKSNYDSDVFMPYISEIENITGIKYQDGDNLYDTAARVISDHIRTSVFLSSESIFPSNEGRGYVFRRILRRLFRYALKLNLNISNLVYIGNTVVLTMALFYPEIRESFGIFEKIISDEFERFKGTLNSGIKLLEDEISYLKAKKIKIINGDFVFKLYDTYGFPIDLTIDAANENNLNVDLPGFEKLMRNQKSYSKQKKGTIDFIGLDFDLNPTIFTGYNNLEEEAEIIGFLDEEGNLLNNPENNATGFIISDKTPFYAESGGQKGDEGIIEWQSGDFKVDKTIKTKSGIFLHHGRIIGQLNISEISSPDYIQVKAFFKVNQKLRRMTEANHSATHLLHAALREVLGDASSQQGSYVDSEKLRFDFNYSKPLTDEEIRKIETIVNDFIFSNYAVQIEETEMEAALNSGALHFFDEKYGDKVRIVSIGNASREFCGGTHIERTGSIGFFKIISESSVASGIRRIEAVTGYNYLNAVYIQEDNLNNIMVLLNSNKADIYNKIIKLYYDYEFIEKENKELKYSNFMLKAGELNKEFKKIGNYSYLIKKLDSFTPDELKDLANIVKSKHDSSADGDNFIIIFGSFYQNEKIIYIAITEGLIDAAKIIKLISEELGGKGGGKKDFAQGGTSNLSKYEEFETAAEKIIKNYLK
ncbi:MAG: alanine--tRNA ligase [bacterium]